MRLRPADLLLCATLLVALPAAPQARESDRQQPMSIAADQTDTILTEDGESRLSGNVSIAQGSLQITAANATFARKAGEVVRVVFEGTPATLQQENDNGAMMKAQGNRIEYNVESEIVTLTGNVSVDQAGDNMRGERIVYNLKDGRLNGAGDGSSDGRIRMTIQPRPPKPEKADADATKEEGGQP